MTNSRLVNYTNSRLDGWYQNAKEYNVIGNAIARIENEKIIIDYIENGVSKTWSMYLYENEDINYYFNVWSEQG